MIDDEQALSERSIKTSGFFYWELCFLLVVIVTIKVWKLKSLFVQDQMQSSFTRVKRWNANMQNKRKWTK